MKFFAGLLATVAIVAFLVTPANAGGNRKKDKATSAFCASGKHVKDVAKCKENGGNK